MAFRKLTIEQLIKELDKYKFKQLHIHHTWKPTHRSFKGNNHEAMQQSMKNYHVNTNGWNDIGQNLTLFPDGVWLTGRPFDVSPASIRGWNTGALCVEMVGNFDKIGEQPYNSLGYDELKGEQNKQVLLLMKYFINKYGEDSIKFHKEGPGVTKSCPGTSLNKYSMIKDAKSLVSKGTNILNKPTATIKQMQEWAKGRKSHPKFIELAEVFYNISVAAGVNPILTYAQSGKETGYFNFGGVIDITYNNPCGMKGASGGGNYDPAAHKKFTSWEEGIQAQVDHLALYAGQKGYPKPNTPDPRHFYYIKGTTTTVEGLGGKWAPSMAYGDDIVKMMKAIETIKVIEDVKINPMDIIDISLHGKNLQVEGIFKDKVNYIPVRFLEDLGYSVTWKDNKVNINYRKD